MRIGLITQLHGRPGGDTPPPTWKSVSLLATAAETVGFDMFVFEDALMHRGETSTDGFWESGSIAAAIAATTERIEFGQSVVNSPYRSPALTASIATTLDEISGGRYVLGIGAGGTPDSDYEGFGFPADRRYSRFAEAIKIIHTLLRTGSVDFSGDYYTASQAELVLRGPHAQGPPINIAAAGSKMLRLAARYGDAWNWWGPGETVEQAGERLRPILADLEAACGEEGRDPASLARTYDLYSVVPPGRVFDDAENEQSVAGSPEEIAGFILGLADYGFSEVRCDLTDKTPVGVEAMASVVDLVHAG